MASMRRRNEQRLAHLRKRVSKHRHYTRGKARDEALVLDEMGLMLHTPADQVDTLVDRYAVMLLAVPKRAQPYVDAAARDWFAAAVVNRLRALQWTVRWWSPRRWTRPQRALRRRLESWQADLDSGKVTRPRRKPGGHRSLNLYRDTVIAAAVIELNEYCGLPHESHGARSGCSAVADRLGESYATIRTVFRSLRQVRQLAEQAGEVPRPKGTGRRGRSRSGVSPSSRSAR